MTELIQDNWVLFLIALVIGVLVAWWIFAASRRTRVELGSGTEDDAPAKRNQALIDAPPAVAATVPPTLGNPQAVGLTVAGAVPDAPVVTVDEGGGEGGDDLTRIKGLGPKLAEQLRGLGVTSFAQIAGWDDAEIDRIDGQLGRFQGRIRRDDWPGQARLLAGNDIAGYQAQYGKL
jgi:predicted flap endonuclease-1-like 5' DNA nuclease